jgi:hypothetical protein
MKESAGGSSGLFSILLTSSEAGADDPYWQRECRRLYDQLRRAIETGELKPLELAASEGDRSSLIELFHMVAAGGLTA